MKPKPFSSLNHFTVPVAMSHLPPSSTVVPGKNVPSNAPQKGAARGAFFAHLAALEASLSGAVREERVDRSLQVLGVEERGGDVADAVVEQLAAHHELARTRRARALRQPLRAAARRREAHNLLHQPEPRRLGGEDQVAAERHLETPREAERVNRGKGGQRHVLKPTHNAHESL